MSFDLDNLLGLLFFVVFIILPIFSRGKKKGQPQPGQPATRTPSRPPVAPGRGGATVGRVPLPGQSTASADQGSSATITLEEIRRRVQEAQQRELGPQRTSVSTQEYRSSPSTTSAASPPRRSLVSSDPFEGSLVSGSSQSVLGREGTPVPLGQPGSTILGREGSGLPQTSLRPAVLGREGAPPSGAGRSPGVLGREGLPGRQGPSGAALRSSRRAGVPGPLGREGTDRSARAAAAAIGTAHDPTQLRYGVTGSKLSPGGPLRFDRTAIMQGLIWHEILGEPPSIKRLRRTRSRLH